MFCELLNAAPLLAMEGIQWMAPPALLAESLGDACPHENALLNVNLTYPASLMVGTEVT